MLDPWYVTGFCDGEAAFTYSRSGASFGLYFAVKQRADNAQIVEDIKIYFKSVGNIYQVKEAPPTKNSGFTKPSTYYRVTKLNELLVIINHFDKYPLNSKKKLGAYKAWKAMVMHKINNFRSADCDIMRSFANKLSSLNSQSRAYHIRYMQDNE